MDIKALVIRDTDSNPAWASPLAGLWKSRCALLHGKPGSFGEQTGGVNKAGGQVLHGPGSSVITRSFSLETMWERVSLAPLVLPLSV